MHSVFPSRSARRAAAALLAALLLACGDAPSEVVNEPPAPPVPPSDGAPPRALVGQRLDLGLVNPWDLAFAADGTLFFTERCRGLSVRRTDARIIRLFGTGDASLVANDLVCLGQSGLLGVALDPQFPAQPFVYVFMASNRSTAPRTNRVVRLRVNDTYSAITERVDIVSDIAFKDAATANGGAGAHSGGRIRFGPDGFLYVATGDNHDGVLPQHPTRLGGKVLRITRDGAAAPGNNTPTGFDPRIYAYGVRNVQGLDFRPGTGQPFIGDHGPNHTDEVTPLVAGGNGGWDPQNRAGLACPGGYCGYSGNPTSMPMTDLARFPNALRPSWENNGASQGLGPITFLRGTMWGEWQGRLLVGIMGNQRLELLTLDAAGRTTRTEPFVQPPARFRSLAMAPDGALWYVTDAGALWRVTLE
jgi:glucose/arabinose dehydrogenase